MLHSASAREGTRSSNNPHTLSARAGEPHEQTGQAEDLGQSERLMEQLTQHAVASDYENRFVVIIPSHCTKIMLKRGHVNVLTCSGAIQVAGVLMQCASLGSPCGEVSGLNRAAHHAARSFLTGQPHIRRMVAGCPASHVSVVHVPAPCSQCMLVKNASLCGGQSNF